MRKITNAAVIGSGIMGGGIAALLAGAGIRTLLLDIVPPDLKEAEKDDPAARIRLPALCAALGVQGPRPARGITDKDHPPGHNRSGRNRRRT